MILLKNKMSFYKFKNLTKVAIVNYKKYNFCTVSPNNTQNVQTITKENISNKLIAGFTSLTFFSNVIYSLMRAKGRGNPNFLDNYDNPYDGLIRFCSFCMGFPFSLFPYLLIKDGSNKVFGIDLSFMD